MAQQGTVGSLAGPDGSGVVRVLDARALNGETPTWAAERERLFWVDLREPALHEFDPATGRDETWAMPAFGGEALGTVFVTSATWPLSEEERRRRPQEGGLFAFTVPVPGMPATHVRLAE